WEPPVPREKPEHIELGGGRDLTQEFKRLLAAPNICSKRWITEQYETYVQLVGLQRPGGDAGVVRVRARIARWRWRWTATGAGATWTPSWGRCTRSRKRRATWPARVRVLWAQPTA